MTDFGVTIVEVGYLIVAKNNNGELLRAHALVERIRTLIIKTRNDSFEQALATMDRHESRRTRDLDTNFIQHYRIGPQLAEMAGELESTLSEAGYEYRADEDLLRRFQAGETWSLGTELEVFPPRKILRGFLVPAREVPTRVRIPLHVFAFLEIDGDKDLLDRDNDQFGIHYHYVLASKQRTTTMICWDTRWQSVDSTDRQGLKLRPIFHELHGEGKYTKVARPHGWGNSKRQSVREACVSDLRKWDIQAFRCASNNADPVWPIGATLTPPLKRSASKKRKK